jgi:hypothetical protein
VFGGRTATVDHWRTRSSVSLRRLAGLDELLDELFGLVLRRSGELHAGVEHPLEERCSSHVLSLPLIYTDR